MLSLVGVLIIRQLDENQCVWCVFLFFLSMDSILLISHMQIQLIFPLPSFQHDQLHSANEDLLARVETLQCNTKLLEAQILELQKVKAKAEKELEAEKLLKEQKIKVILCRDGEWIEALLSVNVTSGRVL